METIDTALWFCTHTLKELHCTFDAAAHFRLLCKNGAARTRG